MEQAMKNKGQSVPSVVSLMEKSDAPVASTSTGKPARRKINKEAKRFRMQRYRAKQGLKRKQEQLHQEMIELRVRLEEIQSISATSSTSNVVEIADQELPVEGLVDVVPESMVIAAEEDLCKFTGELVDVVKSLCQLCETLKDMITAVSAQLSQSIALNRSLSGIGDRSMSVLTSPSDSSFGAFDELLTEQQRQLLDRHPIVNSDDQWAELLSHLQTSGQQGDFLDVLVKTVGDRIGKKADVHKAANAALRAIFAEPFIAERVTMAGYKKRENSSARYYGPADSRFIKIGRGALYHTIYEVVKTACQRQTTEQEIQKAIREGVNTIRLHDKDVRRRASMNDERRMEEDSV